MRKYNSALKRLANNLGDFKYKVEQLKSIQAKEKELKDNNEIDKGLNSNKHSFDLKELELNLIRINNVN